MKAKFAWLFGCTLAGLSAAEAAAQSLSSSDALLGDVGAAYSSAVGAVANPANAAFVDRSQVFFEPELIKQESLDVRYPGYDTTDRSDAGLGSLVAVPALVFKPTAHFGIGGYVLPPGISTQFQQSRIPLYVIGQQSYVDIAGSGKLGGAAQVFAGYRFNDHVGLGFNVTYQAISFAATLVGSDTGKTLATVTGDQSNTDITIGLRLDPAPGRFGLGLAVDVVSIQKSDMNVQSPLLNSIGGSSATPASTDQTGGSAAQSTLPVAHIQGGVMIGLGERMRIMADGVYTRVDKTQTGYSLINQATEPKDLHDTVAFRSGAIVRVTDSANGLFGFRYEPSSIGAGSKTDGIIGFGTQDLVMIETGFFALTPYYQASVGIQLGFLPREASRGKKHEPLHYYALMIETGLVYRYASLGIDENGELPGAYLYKKTSIPLGLTYKF